MSAIEVVEPATAEVMAEVPRGDADDVDAAVARAKEAFGKWRAVTPEDRSALMHALADAVDERREELATLEARNAGKPIGDARGEIGMVVETFRYYAAAPQRLLGDTIPVAGGVDMTFREPLGVVGMIVPWNFPLTIACWKVAPALAAGNTIVLKPAALTPLTALELEKIAVQAGLAEGVLNVVAGPGSVCGRRLVERSALDQFMGHLEGAVKGMSVGDPLADETEMGPLISADQLETVGSYLDDEAPVAFRGSAPDGPGFWFAPTVLCPVSNDDRQAREEIFGPIASVIPFEGEEEAIAIANDTPYGLSGSVWTRDGAKALRAARAIETGVMSINSNTSVRVSTPFGGFKQSGVGRELGPHALDHYTEVKNVYYATEGS